ncbi:MAG: hydrolase, partial [Aureispira sp.]|nr:hydrolase [Aureispira sp.]
MKQLLILMVLGSLATNLLGQIDSSGKKAIQAIYVEKGPKIDGVLDDAVWADAPIATDFIENTPNPGRKASQRTEVKVLYTTEGIYIGAKMYDTAADSILKQLSVRDATGNVNADN